MHSIAWKTDPLTNCPAGYLIQHMVPMNSNYYLPCDGRTLQANSFPELYKVIGTTFGGGNGVFNLPDMRNKFSTLVYQEYWEMWPCIHCGKIFADGHDRSSWWCHKDPGAGMFMTTYTPMTNLEYLELKVTEKEKLCPMVAGSMDA